MFLLLLYSYSWKMFKTLNARFIKNKKRIKTWKTFFTSMQDHANSYDIV